MSTYTDKLNTDRWRRFSEDVKRRDGYKCVQCNSTDNLHVHHKIYYNYRDPWDYAIDLLETLCCKCHNQKHLDIDIKSFSVTDKNKFKDIKRKERVKYREINKKNNIYKRGMTAQEIYNIMNKKQQL